jgi:hypothetical protein
MLKMNSHNASIRQSQQNEMVATIKAMDGAVLVVS